MEAAAYIDEYETNGMASGCNQARARLPRGINRERARGFGSRHRNGFTLIETMTSLAIMAVLTASAVPVYSHIVGNSEIRSATDSIAYGLRVARNEAIKGTRSLRSTL